MGGRDKIIAAAQASIKEKDHAWAAELLAHAIHANPDDQEARQLAATVLRAFAYEQTSVVWRWC